MSHCNAPQTHTTGRHKPTLSLSLSQPPCLLNTDAANTHTHWRGRDKSEGERKHLLGCKAPGQTAPVFGEDFNKWGNYTVEPNSSVPPIEGASPRPAGVQRRATTDSPTPTQAPPPPHSPTLNLVIFPCILYTGWHRVASLEVHSLRFLAPEAAEENTGPR